MKWTQLPLNCRLYLFSIGLFSLPLALFSFAGPNQQYKLPWALLSFASLSVAAINLSLPQIPTVVISMGDVFTFVVLINFGPGPALLTYWANVIATALSRQIRIKGFGSIRNLAIHRLLFNLSCSAVSIYAMYLVYTKATTKWGTDPSAMVLTFFLVAVVWFLANTGMLSLAVSLASGRAFISVWREGLSLYLLNSFCSTAAGALLSTFINTKLGYYSFFLSIPIALGVFQLYSFYVQKFQAAGKHIADLNKLYLQTVETLASAVDAKDRYTHGHIRRVQAYAMELAKCIGITGEDELLGLRAGALLHDIGKIAIPEYILNKPAALTENEYAKMKLHPGIGSGMLKNIEFPYPVVPMVRSHHERWDGKGYPDGLSGEQIAIGARILSLVDCYDALTTNRPYRSPMKREELIEFFERESGKAYDPAIVTAFVENLPRLEQAGKDVGADDDDPWGIREQFKKETPTLRPLENAQPIQIYSKTLKGNGQSQKDLFSVFEFARADIHYLTAKDILVFMGSKLADLIEFDAGVFYVADLESSTVIAKHVMGKDGDPLLNHSMPLEQKLSGWAAANNESLPNLPPDPDFANWQGEKPTFHYSIVAPMNTAKVVLGAVTLYRKGDTKFSDEERRKLELVASQTGVALAKSGKASQENQMVDKLTGLPNGYQLYFMYDQVAIDASRFDYSIALLTIRLDDAKLRRRWGHAVGDDAVRNVATYLSKEIRETDLLVRYANDEFIILVPRVDLEKSEGLKSRFQDELDHFRFQVRPGTYTSLPVSIGISMFPSDGATLDELITTAEWRMQEDAELRVAVKSGLRSLPPNA